jgi:hypothetical protein
MGFNTGLVLLSPVGVIQLALMVWLIAKGVSLPSADEHWRAA